MKKIIASLALGVLLALPGMAQHKAGHTPHERAMKKTEKMTEKLNLSGEQKEAVYAANLEMAQNMEENRAEAMKANDAKMREILTEEQYTRLKKQQVHKRKKAGHMKESKEQKMEMKDSPRRE